MIFTFVSRVVRDVYRNIPEVSGEMKDNCKQLFFKKNEGFLSSKSELKQSSPSSDDPLGYLAVKSNKLSSEKVLIDTVEPA